MTPRLQTAVHYWPVRNVPPPAAGEFAKHLEGSGVVDWFQTWDQLVSFYPRALWTPENTPLTAVQSDCDSFHDSDMISAIAATATEDLGITTSTDAIRESPAELLRTMLTLASCTNGRTSVQIGAGELKQCKPFGFKRSQGLARMEDLFRIIRKLLESDGLVSHEGNHWIYNEAWIGGVRPKRLPEFWALGGGPKLMDIATSYADGIVSATRLVFSDPDDWATEVKTRRDQLEQKGRNIDAFTFGLWPVMLLCDDEGELEEMLDNRLLKWIAAIFGRFNHSDWEKEGFDLIFPANWHYAVKLLPHTIGEQELEDILAQVSIERVKAAFITGTPQQVADQLQPYVDAGANFLSYFDMTPSVTPLDRQERAAERVIELCARMKAANTDPSDLSAPGRTTVTA